MLRFHAGLLWSSLGNNSCIGARKVGLGQKLNCDKVETKVSADAMWNSGAGIAGCSELSLIEAGVPGLCTPALSNH